MSSVSPCRISCLSVSGASGATGADVWSDVCVESDVDVDISAEAETDVCWVRRRANSSFFFAEHPFMPASLQRVRSSARDFLE